MTLHHTKHHQTYVTGLNAAEEAYTKTETPRERIKLQAALKFNGGGTRIIQVSDRLAWLTCMIPLRPHQPFVVLEEPRSCERGWRKARGWSVEGGHRA